MLRLSAKGFVAIGVVLLGVGNVANAQMPSIPGIPGGAPGAAGGLAGGDALASGQAGLAAVPAQRTIWGFFGITPANCAACRQRICASPLGAMLNGLVGPAATMTGGLIPTFCPAVPTDAQVAAAAAAGGPTGAEAVAAKIKQDEADAKARRAAIRYLSTASCHYWPEAEAAIIGGLRDDRNECVRYEAALALLNGCCCTAKTIEALNIVVAGSEKDGKPSELSERVKQVSLAALQGCLLRYHPPAQPIPLERPEPASASASNTPEQLPPGFQRVAYYYQTIKDVPPELIVAEAGRTIDRATALGASTSLITGKRTVYHALARAATTPDPIPTRPGPSPDPTAAPPPPLIPTQGATPPKVPNASAGAEKGDGLRLTSFRRSDPAPVAERRAFRPIISDNRATARPDVKERNARKDVDKPATPRAQTSTSGRRNLRDILIDSLSPSGGR
jgi:hypothetical protein